MEGDSRAFIALQIRSLLPLVKQMIATGQGKEILSPALQAAQMRVNFAAKQQAVPLHWEGLVHFWFSELNRLGFTDQSVPVVRLR